MIFKKLFSSKKKWQSEKVSERLAAVAELDTLIPENKSILHELAFNDADDKVRRAALEKLNDFALWWQASKKESSELLKKLAEKNIISALSGKTDIPLSSSDKRTFIKECSNNTLLQQVVFDVGEESLILETLSRLNKENLYFKAIIDSELSEQSKLELLADVNQESVLKRLAKKLDDQLLLVVEEKLAAIKFAAELPVRLEKQARLLLAQLNALKDKSDFELISNRQEHINSEWTTLAEQFVSLNNATVSELELKRTTINEAIERILAPLKQKWLDEQEQAQKLKREQTNFQNIVAELTAIESQVTQAIADDTDIDQQSVTAAINLLRQHSEEQELSTEGKVELVYRVENLFERANQVPKIKSCIAKAKEIVNELNQLTLPADLSSLNEVNPTFKTLKAQWKDNITEVGLALPSELNDEYESVLSSWLKVIPSLEKEQRQLFNQTRRKLSELEDLIRQGRFHNAFGLYKKLGFWFEELNDYQKNQLDRKWQTAQQEIEKLHELEKSFSNPKKQELLVDIEKLADNPLPDPTEQAHRVRLLRSNWQSLGHAGDEQEETLNSQFNELCERAFSTCREHYKQLEDERSGNLEAKILIIEQLETLATNLKTSEVSSWREIESIYVKLSRLWRETGLIDRDKVNDINHRYQSALKPVRNAINDHHKQNEIAKSELIEKAKVVALQDIAIFEKINQLKSLQNEWQKVGFAGKNKDQSLWSQFRAINNPVFEQRDDAKKQQQEKNQIEYERIKSQFDDIEKQLSDSSNIASLKDVIAANEQATKLITDLAKGQIETLRKQSQKISKSANSMIAEFREAEEKRIYLDLFSAIEDLANGKPADTANLKPSWASAINLNSKEDRRDVTLKLELSAGLDSPDQDAAKRNKIQMDMLSMKMEQGIQVDHQELLESWLSAGIFGTDDLDLLERIKPIFL